DRSERIVGVDRLDQYLAEILTPGAAELMLDEIAGGMQVLPGDARQAEAQVKVIGSPGRVQLRWRVREGQLLLLDRRTREHLHQRAVLDRVLRRPIVQRTVDPQTALAAIAHTRRNDQFQRRARLLV